MNSISSVNTCTITFAVLTVAFPFPLPAAVAPLPPVAAPLPPAAAPLPPVAAPLPVAVPALLVVATAAFLTGMGDFGAGPAFLGGEVNFGFFGGGDPGEGGPTVGNFGDLFLERSSGWIFGNTPPAAMVTFLNS